MIISLTDFKVGKPDERVFKKAFLAFQRMYFRRWHSVHLLEKGDTHDKEGYMEDKSHLLYLPSVTPNGLKKLEKYRLSQEKQDFLPGIE